MRRILGLILMACFFSAIIAAQKKDSRNYQPKKLQEELQKVQELFHSKHIQEALDLLTVRYQSPEFSRFDNDLQITYQYYLACCHSLLGHKDEAFVFLNKAVEAGYENYAEMKENHNFDNIREDKEFQEFLDTIRSRGDFLEILKKNAAYDYSETGDAPLFTYQKMDYPGLAELRKTYGLDGVARNGDEISKIINLMKWAHKMLKYEEKAQPPQARNALSLIKSGFEQNRGFNSRMIAIVLNEVYLAMGFKSRHVTCLSFDDKDRDGHVINAVYVNSLSTWIYMDATLEAYFRDEDGNFLSIEEVRSRIISGGRLNLNNGINLNGEPYDEEKYLLFMAKHLVRLQCPLSSESGYESKSGERRYVQLDPVSYQPGIPDGMIHIHNPGIFWRKP